MPARVLVLTALAVVGAACGGSGSQSSPTPAVTASAGATTTTQPGLTYESEIHPKGVGPVLVGMTLREANAAARRTLRVAGTEDFGGTCYFADVDGLDDIQFQAEPDKPPADPLDGPIAMISVGEPRFRTEKGIHVGSAQADVTKAYPGAESDPYHYDENGRVFTVERDGGSMMFVTDGRTVREIQVGSYRLEGCA